MGLATDLRRLARLVDEVESTGVTVTDADIEPTTDGPPVGLLRVRLERVDLEDDITVERSAERSESVTPDGDDAAQPGPASTEPAGGVAGDSHSATAATAPVERGLDAASSGAVGYDCPEPDCDAAFETETGLKIHRTKIHRSDGDDPPAYKDPDRLRAVYESCESFPEMRDALGASVSAQTVRRYAIQHGIHDPGTRDTSERETAATDDSPDPELELESDVEPGSETVPSDDGASVTGPLSVDDVRRAIEDARTPREVALALGMEREAATQLLRDLDLLDLVYGRTATVDEREARKDELDERLADASVSGVLSD